MAAISGDIGARRNVLTGTRVFIINVQANESISRLRQTAVDTLPGHQEGRNKRSLPVVMTYLWNRGNGTMWWDSIGYTSAHCRARRTSSISGLSASPDSRAKGSGVRCETDHSASRDSYVVNAFQLS